jgi:hypothetical protein
MIFQLLFALEHLFNLCLLATLVVGSLYWLVWLVSLTVPHHQVRYQPTWVEQTVRDLLATPVKRRPIL